MKVTELGVDNNKILMLLPGTSCTWKMNFKFILDDLQKEYHLLCVDYTGYDDLHDTFTTMLDETKKIEDYLLENYNGHIDAVYGSSLGGSFASLLTQKNIVHFDHVFIGSSDLDQASPFVAKIETNIVYYFMKAFENDPNQAIQKMSKMKSMKKKSLEGKEIALSMMKDFFTTFSKVKKESIKNQFYSDLVTKIDDHIDIPRTTIHVLFAQKMGEKYLKRYHQHYLNPDIIPLDYDHEGWLGSSII